jgi:hypothetical protein
MKKLREWKDIEQNAEEQGLSMPELKNLRRVWCQIYQGLPGPYYHDQNVLDMLTTEAGDDSRLNLMEVKNYG